MKPIDKFLLNLSRQDIKFSVEGDLLRLKAPQGKLTNILKTEIADRKAEIIAFLRDAEQSFSIHIQPVSRDQELPLSFAQQRLWFINQLESNSATYNMPGAVRLQGKLDVSSMEKTLQEIIRRHEALRTNFISQDGQPRQVINQPGGWHMNIIDLQQLPASEREERIQKLVTAEEGTPFALDTDPLVRATLLLASETEHILLLTMHHIVSDGWSIGVFVEEIATLYTAFVMGEPSPLPELEIQYVDFAVWQRQWLQGENLERQLRYWQQQLADAPALLELPADRPRPPVQTFHGASYESVIPSQIAAVLDRLTQQEGVTLFMTLLTAFDILLHRYTGQADVIVGSPIANRNHAEIENLIGFFVNTLVLRSDLSGNPTFRELLHRVREVALGAYAHQDLPFEMLVETLQPERNLSHSPLFQVMFILQNTPMSNLELPGVTLSQVKTEGSVSPFDLTLSLASSDEGLITGWEYNTDLFDASTIERMAKHFETLLFGIIANPDQPISMLPILSDTEQQLLLLDWNNTKTNYPQDLLVHQLFEQQVEKTPQAIAVVFGDEQFTYSELNQRANQLANHLQTLGVKPEILVGLCVERSLEMIVGMLAILKADGAYVPLDPDYPPERLAYMLADAEISLLLTQEQLLNHLPINGVQVVCLDRDWPTIAEANTENLVITSCPENLAYVIYTSGSTGQPKGVMITQQNLVNFSQAAISAYEITSADRILQFASVSFDVAAEEIYPGLIQGATIYLRTTEMLNSPSEFWQHCQAWKLTLIDLPTAYWQQLMSDLVNSSTPLPTAVRLVIIGGERANPAQVQLWQKQVGEYPKLINAYGPTEATVEATYCDLTNVQLWEGQEVPIGKPLNNVQTYILDAQLQSVPVGVPGELHIGGAGIARGYLNQPELTAEKFIVHPFSDDSYSRLYKTGDLVKYLLDGNIEYLGRIDQQVKIRGFRIELGEVEAAINQYSQVSQVTVIDREDIPGNKQLVAYVVPQSHEEINSTEIRAFLKDKLPSYMVPSTIVNLDELPLTPNGKVDHKALPIPDMTQQSAASFVAPSTPIEERLGNIWSEVLKVEKVSIHDNFFELGGHSLTVIQIMSKLNEIFQTNLPLRILFENQTITELAQVIKLNNELDLDLTIRKEIPPAEIVDLSSELILDSSIQIGNLVYQPGIKPSAILVTGATGFVGAFLVAELLKETQAIIYCLVRASSSEESLQRIIKSAESYLLWNDELYTSRIIPVVGDLSKPLLGLTAKQFETLASQLDVIYHNGALVNHIYSYAALKNANVGGTQEVLRLACQSKIKPVHFISTSNVFFADEYFRTGIVREDDRLEYTQGFDVAGGYVQSKWVAEKLMIISRDHGLPCSIFRIGGVSWHSQTGVWNCQDTQYRFIKSCFQMGNFPILNQEIGVGVLPVDYVSQAIVHLSQQPTSLGKSFHLVDRATIPWSRFVNCIQALEYPLQELSYDNWKAELTHRAKDFSNSDLTFLSTLLTEETSDQEAKTSLQFDYQNTGQGLINTEIKLPEVDDELIHIFFSHFIKTIVGTHIQQVRS